MKIEIDIDEEYYNILKYEVEIRHNEYKPIVLIANGKPVLKDKKGHWVYLYTFTDGVYYRCSECGFIDKLNTPKKLLYNKCPNCDAKMESEVK